MDADFVIVGGGIAGVSAAASLAALGSVVLVEREAVLGHHASGRSAALYEPRYGAAAVVALSLAGGDVFRASGLLSARGLMIVGRKGDAEVFARDIAAMDLRRVSLAEARAVVPVLNAATVTEVAMADHAWDIDTDLMLQGYARQARSRGAKIVVGAEVTGIAREGAGWRVVTSQGDHTAAVVVNAGGAWADDVAVMAGVRPVGLVPMRRSMARIPAPGGHDVRGWPMIFGAGETWYAKPDAGALIVSPAEEDACVPHDAFADDMVLAEGLARYEEMVTEPVTRMLANWAGLRTFAPDRVLVIGRDVREPGFFWLAGQGGYGFQTAPGASALIGDLVDGRASELGDDLVAALSPVRFG